MIRFLAGHRATDDRGAAATEYALLVVLIAVLILSSVAALGTGLRSSIKRSCHQVAMATNLPGGC